MSICPIVLWAKKVNFHFLLQQLFYFIAHFDLEYGIVCRRNMDVDEGGHSTTGIVWNVDLEKVNENQLDWTPIQSRGFGHGG